MSTNMGLESDFYDIRKKKSSCCCERPINTDNSLLYTLWSLQRQVIISRLPSVFLCIFWTALNPLLVFKKCFRTLILVWEKNTTEGKSFTVLQSPTSMFLNF